MPGNKLSQPTCKGCGQLITSTYVTALGNTWHPEHFVCAACGQPIGDTRFQLHEGAAYHPACYRDRVAPRCAYCHKPLVGKFLEDHWGTKFCEKHKDEYPTCAFCGRLVPPPSNAMSADAINRVPTRSARHTLPSPPQQQKAGATSSGEIRCSICLASAIEKSAAARSIFTSMQHWVKSQGLTYDNIPLSLELCDRSQLTNLLKGRGGTDTLGITLSTMHRLNGQEVRAEINGIAVLRGMPSTLFQGVLVHELGHVWLIMHGIKDLPSWAEEGFCELLSHRYYSELATAQAGYHAKGIEQSSDPAYGEGFRRVRLLADSVGFQRLVETLSTSKRLPTSTTS